MYFLNSNICDNSFTLFFSVLLFLSLLEEVVEVAKTIAEKSPVAIQGTKRSLIYSRDHTVQDGLNHIVSFV